MAVRDLTLKFLKLRKRLLKPVRDNYAFETKEDLLKNSASNLLSKNDNNLPNWIENSNHTKIILSTIKSKLKTLKSLHEKRLRINFNEKIEENLNNKISVLTYDITKLFRNVENSIKLITIPDESNSKEITSIEKEIRLNLMRSYAFYIQHFSKKFSIMQKDFMDKIKKQEKSSYGILEDENDVDYSYKLDENSLTNHGSALKMETKNKNQYLEQREAEILKILKSINDLSKLFEELNILVIEQGSLLDRIDFNIKNTEINIKHTENEIIKKNEKQKNATSTFIIFCLLIAIFICSIILIIK